MEQSKMLSLSNRIYTLLLHAYPAPFRREYGREMAQVFRDDVRGTLRESGTAALIGLWLLTLFDLVKTAITEHIWEVFHMSVEKLERWTGLAAGLGGALSLILTFSVSRPSWDEFVQAKYVIVAVLAIAMFMLWAIALAGLYRQLPAASHTGKKVTFAIVLFSLLLSVIGLLVLPLTPFGLTIILLGYFGLGLSVAGMGIIALRYGALGTWSFVPLLLAVLWLGFLVSYIQGFSSQDFLMDSPLELAFGLLLGISWILLGVALWTSTKEEAGPALLA